jgi:hypothetical protein
VFLPRLFRETNLRLSPVNPPDLRHCIRVEQVCAWVGRSWIPARANPSLPPQHGGKNRDSWRSPITQYFHRHEESHLGGP